MSKKTAKPTLLAAIFSGKPDRVSEVLKSGGDPNSTGWGVNAQAAAQQNEELKDSLETDTPESLGQSTYALNAAAQLGNAAICTLLIDAGADLDVVDKSDALKSMTPLLVAAAHGHLEVVKLLVERGCDVLARDSWARTATALAAELGNKEIVQFLQSHLSKLDRKWSLPEAAVNGLTTEVKVLLKNGESPDAIDTYGLSSLTYACNYYFIDIVDAILAAGANPNLGADFDKAHNKSVKARIAGLMELVEPPSSKLTYARIVGHNPIRSFLYGEPPLIAVCGCKRMELARKLIAAGADVNAQSKIGGVTPVMMTIKAQDAAMFQMLLDAGADIRLRDKAGGTCLEWSDLEKTMASPMSELFDIIKLLKAKLGLEEKQLDFKKAWKEFKEVDASEPYKKVIEQLTTLCQSKPYPWKKRKGVYRFYPKDWDGLAARYGKPADYHSSAKRDQKHDRKVEITRHLQDEIRKTGYTLLSHKDEQGSDMQLLFPTKDKYAIIAACGTDGANYGLSTDMIIETLQDIENQYPFEITDCMHDALGGTFTAPIKHPLELAKTLCDFCNSLVDGEMTTSAEDVADEIKKSNRFYLWWD